MKILIITPPMTQLNTPYPASAYLTGFLKKHLPEVDVVQADPAIELVCRLFSKEGLTRAGASEEAIRVVEPTMRFLQGRDPSLAVRIVSRKFLPEGKHFMKALGELSRNGYLDFAFGSIGVQDRAKYFASLFIDDLALFMKEKIDPRFELSRYAEKLAASKASFDELNEAIESKKQTLVDEILDEVTTDLYKTHKPDVVAITLPFPGNVYAGFKMAKKLKSLDHKIKIMMGGGFVNTELRELTDARVFNYVDYFTLDDGEKPVELVLKHIAGKVGKEKLLRTFVKEDDKVAFYSDKSAHDVAFKESGTPTYVGLPLDKYLSVLEMLNPMHRLWSDARWNKATLAHGCYWKKCSFCDVTLDYIGRYDAAGADLILDRMTALAEETGNTGFHFVDEAAPPATLKALSERMLEKKLSYSWWGNLRFDKAFTKETAALMSRAGCIAVTGGLEVASDRLLKLMNKGVSIEQVARVTKAFNDAGIMVHAYLMYGFPTETTQETVDSLEVVRQLFANGCLDSAYWHRFSATAHSPIGKNPDEFGIKLKKPKVKGEVFAVNDLEFTDPTGTDHDALGVGLKKGLYNFMHGIGLDEDVRVWFDEIKAPKTTVPKNLIAKALKDL